MKKKTFLLLISVLLLSLSMFAQKNNSLVKDLKDYAFIPQGKCRFIKQEFDVNAFFISRYEVSNEQYREFLDSLIMNNDIEKLRYAGIDTNQWTKVFGNNFNAPLINYYSNHKAYNKYPVVNISYEGAMLYCKWLSDKYNRMKKDKSVIFEFSLPTKEQWIMAARGNSNSEYSWEGPYLAGKTYYCNFKNLGAENIHYNPKTRTYEIVATYLSDIRNMDISAPVKSYFPNKHELYNMCGNVAEMLAEKGIAIGGSWNDSGYDVRVESLQEYETPLPYIGFRPVMTIKQK